MFAEHHHHQQQKQNYYQQLKKVSTNPKWKTNSTTTMNTNSFSSSSTTAVTPKLIEFDHKFNYKKVDKMFFANILNHINFINRNAYKKTKFNSKGIYDRRDYFKSNSLLNRFNNDEYGYLSTSQLLASSNLSQSQAITNTNTNNQITNIEAEFLEETQIIDEMSDEQAIAIDEQMYNLEEFYQINPQQQRHRISIDLTGNIADDDNSSVSDDEEGNNTINDNMSSKGHANSFSDSFSRLNLNKETSSQANYSLTQASLSSSITPTNQTVPIVPNRFNSPSLSLTHKTSQSRHDSAATNETPTSQTSRGRGRFLRSKTLSENLIQLPQSNLDGSMLIDDLNDKSNSINKRFVSSGIVNKNSYDTNTMWNRAQLNNMKRVKTAIGIRNYNPVQLTTSEFSSITNSVFKQSLSQKYQQNLLAKSSFVLQSNQNSSNNNSNSSTNQVQRELSIIDLQLPINRSFTVAGANLSQQQLLAISKRNNISKLNDYYSVTNSTDYVQQNETSPGSNLINSTPTNLNNVHTTTNNNSSTLASKIILTTLTPKPTHNEHRITRAVSATNADYEIIRNSHNNSVENDSSSNSKKTTPTEFQLTFPFRNQKSYYYKYLQQQQQHHQQQQEKHQKEQQLQQQQQLLQQKKRQMYSAKTSRRPINNMIRHDIPMTDDYLNSISSEALLIRRLKF